MTDQEKKKKFMTDLVKTYGYPEESVKSEVRIGPNVFDVAIQKGTIYIQVFELKNKPKYETYYIYKRFTEVSVDTPFYCVIFNEDGSWKLYDADNLNKPIRKAETILNYKKAIAYFFHYVQKDVSDIIGSIKTKCCICAGFLLAYLTSSVPCLVRVTISPLEANCFLSFSMNNHFC